MNKKCYFLLILILTTFSFSYATNEIVLNEGDNSTVLIECINILQSNGGGTILIKGNVTINENVTVPNDILIDVSYSGSFTIENEKELTINGHLNTGNYQIFNEIGSGRVKGKLKVDKIIPQWFGPENSTSINRAIEVAFNSCRYVFFPAGNYEVQEEGVLLYPHVSICGRGGRETVLQKKDGASGPVVQFKTGITNSEGNSYSFNVVMKNFVIDGGNSVEWNYDEGITSIVNHTVDGLVLNPKYGLDACIFENILIRNCGGYGMKIIDSTERTNLGAMSMQQSVFTNITTQYTRNGCYVEGFVGNIQWNTCTFDYSYTLDSNDGYGFICDRGIGDDNPGAQDMSFYNCAFQHGRYGFHFKHGINFGFYSCHFENNTIRNFVSTANGYETLTFLNCHFTTSLTGIYISGNSNVHVSNCAFKFHQNNAAGLSCITMPYGTVWLSGSNNRIYQRGENNNLSIPQVINSGRVSNLEDLFR